MTATNRCECATCCARRARSGGRTKLLKWSEEKPELKAAWIRAVDRGLAGEFCDRIVREREIPDRLIDALNVAALDWKLVYAERMRDRRDA